MTYGTYVIAALVMISVVVVIHEFGHYAVARFFKVGTPVFSIGMGPRLFGFTWRDTDFRVSLLPIGGYVQMAGADPFGEEDANSWIDPEQDFMKKPVWQRLLIMVAGPAVNIALPFVLFTSVLMLGDPQRDNVINRVVAGSMAEQVGLQAGDRVLSVGAVKVQFWNDLYNVKANPAAVPMVVERGNAQKTIMLPPGAIAIDVDGQAEVRDLGISSFPHSTRIGVPSSASAAWRAGLRPSDAIVEVDDAEVKTFGALTSALAQGSSHTLTVKRVLPDKTIDTLSLTLASDDGDWGVEPLELYIGDVVSESPAAVAGLLANDRLLAVDGAVLKAWPDLIDAVSQTVKGLGEGEEPRPLRLSLARDGEPMELSFAPEMTRQLILGEPVVRPVMGVRQYPDTYTNGNRVAKYFGFFEAFGKATEETTLLVNGMGRMLGNVGTGRVKVTEAFGGPVAIGQAAGMAAEQGLFEFVKMMGRISLGIGILNLLPVPVLDGGQIMFYLLEGLRGRPLPLVLRERILMVGVLMVAALLLVVTVSDVGRLLGG